MGGSTPYSLTKSHRTPWERLGISGPLFVIFLLMGGVTVCTLTWLINQQMHPLQMHPLQTHTLNSTLPGETNSLSFPSYLPQDHTVSRREVGVTKCTPQELKSTTLCLPFNATTTVYLPWGLLGHAQNSLGLPAWTYSSFNWYITKGGYGEWSWKNLVAETGHDWSSYSKGRVVLAWRKRLTFSRTGFQLKLIVRPGTTMGCQVFTLAPYVDTDRAEVHFTLYICVTPEPQPTSVTVRDDMAKPHTLPQHRDGWGSAVLVVTTPTPDENIRVATGISGLSNNWLLLTEQAANTTPTSCVVCMGARPLLRIVPATVEIGCLMPLMDQDNPTGNCFLWDAVYPVVSATDRAPVFSSDVARAEFSCINMTGGILQLGLLPVGWCTNTIVVVGVFKPVIRADIWWWCGGPRLFDRPPNKATGTCALVTLLLPISVYPIGVGDLVTRIQAVDPQFLPTRTKREAALTVGDPTYIDAIGVPRGVPDEYKLVDQVAAGFQSSLCWWCTVNKNVDRINYIHFNVQKLGNWTQQGFEAVHGQLAATSLMAFQNRIAVDMLLAEKGGICFMFGEQCCTFIPNNTASDGSLTVALEGLRTLNGKMKSHSGVDTSTWDSWMDAFGKYKVLVSSILVSISVFVAILTLCGCCCIPCARSLLSRVITSAIAPNNDPALMFPLLQQEDPLVEFETCTYE